VIKIPVNELNCATAEEAKHMVIELRRPRLSRAEQMLIADGSPSLARKVVSPSTGPVSLAWLNFVSDGVDLNVMSLEKFDNATRQGRNRREIQTWLPASI
jgi:hypothetical protein